MKKMLLIGVSIVFITAGYSIAQMGMMGGNQQQPYPYQYQQQYPYQGGPGMMGPGMMGHMGGMGMMGPGMMGPGMMGGYGMGPGMMGPGMMGGYGMGPGMMGGYGMGPGMMGPGMMGGYQQPYPYQYQQRYPYQGGQNYGYDAEKYQKFLDDTTKLRKELHEKQFEYFEATRNPGTKPEMITKLEREIQDLQKKIYEEAPR